MGLKKTALATLIGAAIYAPLGANAAGIEWFGSAYMKFLDGNMHGNDGMYGFGGSFQNGPGGGDQGQAVEFELLFRSQISKQVELGGRLKSRFNRNYFANGGGFGENNTGDLSSCGDECNLESAQYFKLRGTYIAITPGYSWVDSVTLGSNDWGQFDPWTLGKARYTDRDNFSGILAQGTLGDIIRYDVARMSLPKIWAGPRWKTTTDNKNSRDSYRSSLFAQDAAYALQVRYEGMDDLALRGIYEYVIDEELDNDDAGSGSVNVNQQRDGRDTSTRVENNIFGIVTNYTGIDGIDIGGSFYHSDLKMNPEYEGDYKNQYNPVHRGNTSDWSGKLNLNVDFGEFGIDDLSVAVELFRIGSDYVAITGQRREADVLLTEGHEGAFMVRRLVGEDNGEPNGIGIGGWIGPAQQLPTLNTDMEFTDFDETPVQSVLGWQGITIVPKWTIGEVDLAGELSYIDYNSNWQNFDCQYVDVVEGERGVTSNCDDSTTFGLNDSLYPVIEGRSSFGLGPGWREAFAADQEKETLIAVLKAAYTIPVGRGLNTGVRLKFIDEKDERVTSTERFKARYADDDRMNSLNDDDRDYEMFLFEPSIGYQVHDDLYTKLTYSYYDIELIDGKAGWGADMSYVNQGPTPTPNSLGFPSNYYTGEHERQSLLLQLDYFLPGLEVGSSLQWIWHDYQPEFVFNGDGDPGDEESLTVDRSEQGLPNLIKTGMGQIPDEEVKFRQYRMKTWVKVKF